MGGAPGLPSLSNRCSAADTNDAIRLRHLIQLATLDLSYSDEDGLCGERRIIGGRLHGSIDLDGQLTAIIDLRRASDDPDIVAENDRRIAVCDLAGSVTGIILGADIGRFRATSRHPDLPAAVESALASGLAGGVTQIGERLLVALNDDQEKAPARSAAI